jgi:uncharacterized membrane protein
MATMAVFALDTEAGANAMAQKLIELQKQQLITIDDAAVVTRKADGKPKIKQLNDLVGAGALGGAFWGLLFGMLFFMPWMGLAVGAATGAISGKFSDVGIDDQFIKDVGNSIKPGTSALFLITENTVLDKVIPEIKQFNPKVIKTSLSTEQETKLKELIGVETA